MITKKLSIIIPVYNGQDYIGRCLGSVLNQSGVGEHEIIVVNDGSTDNTEKIVKSIAKKNKNIKLINQPNSGVSVARNNGLRQSYGKYVTFIDADDTVGVKQKNFASYFHHEYLNKNLLIGNGYHDQLQISKDFFDYHYFDNMLYAAEFTEADVVFGGKITINYDTNTLMEHVYTQNYVYGQSDEDKAVLLNHADIRESANFAVYNRKLLRKHKLKFVPHMHLDEDMLFCMMAVLYADNVATVKDTTYLYNRHENTLSNIPDADNLRHKYALSTIQRYSVLLDKLYGKQKYETLFNEWLKEYSRQGIKYCSLYPFEFAPQKCAFECDKKSCIGCSTANFMSKQIKQNIAFYMPEKCETR